jgi:uncharacterized membrane protein YeaQ/YmgE (transglycosylase-associated protein family)
MGLLAWIIFGGLAGWVASLLTGTRQGCCLNIIVGVIGAFIGGTIMELVTGRGINIHFNLSSFAVAVFGAVVLLAIANLATRDIRK